MPSQINPRSGPFPVYSSASPPTVDVGIFTIAKTGVDLKNAGTTTIFTVPASRTYVLLGFSVSVTAVNTGGSGTEGMIIKESSGARAMSGTVATAPGTPVAGQTVYIGVQSNSIVFSNCTAGNSVQAVVSTSHAGSTAVTGTIFATGFYVQ